MKMISKTSMTTTLGVTLMIALIARGYSRLSRVHKKASMRRPALSRSGLFSLIIVANVLVTGLSQDRPRYLPDPRLTPGDAGDVTRDEVCRPGYTNPARRVPIELKQQVFERYGIDPSLVGYNVDHLIPVGLGGSNSIKNLWPQPLSGEWTYHSKNRLEHRLRQQVCSGKLGLSEAQQEIARDWVAGYKRFVGSSSARASKTFAEAFRGAAAGAGNELPREAQ
jgi:hypothetical protein